jgi:hypothetical protein
MTHPLTAYANRSRRELQKRLEDISAKTDVDALRERQARCDRFTVSASRHVFATHRVIVDEARHRLGSGSCRTLATACGELERTLLAIRARQYGSAAVAHVPWALLLRRVEDRLTAFMEAEVHLVSELESQLSAGEADELVERWGTCASSAPSRPHPSFRTEASRDAWWPASPAELTRSGTRSKAGRANHPIDRSPTASRAASSVRRQVRHLQFPRPGHRTAPVPTRREAPLVIGPCRPRPRWLLRVPRFTARPTPCAGSSSRSARSTM